VAGGMTKGKPSKRNRANATLPNGKAAPLLPGADYLLLLLSLDLIY
jgi:hypothetical protein